MAQEVTVRRSLYHARGVTAANGHKGCLPEAAKQWERGSGAWSRCDALCLVIDAEA